VAEAVVEMFDLKMCHFRLLSRDQRILEHVAAHGVSERFLNKGPVDAERSVGEALKGKVVMVKDCSSDPRIQYPVEFAEEGIVSLLTVPLMTRGQVIGVMRLGTREERDFDAQAMEIINVVSSFCTSAITHSMFHQILGHVTESIRTSLDLSEVLDSIVRVICEDLRAKGCVLQLLDRSRKNLDVRAANGLSERFLERIETEPGKAATEALKGDCVAVLDARNDPRIPFIEEVIQEGFASMLYVPLVIRDKAIGVLCVVTHHPYNFSGEEIFLMQSIGEQCALAVRNAEMYATIKKRYESVVDDFQIWFEHYHTFPVSER
jgi:signal transduction protein with GAF and PtsI domain